MARRARAPLVVTLTMNPAVDLSFSVDRLEAGRKLRVHDLRRDPGGGGVNVARVIGRLGGRTRAVFPAGGADGDRLMAMLEAERGITACAVPIAGETREDITAEDRSDRREYRFVTPGPRLKAAEIEALAEAAISIAGERPAVVVASGSLPPGAPLGFYARLAKVAHAQDLRLALDAGGAPLRLALAAGVWLVKPNLAELEELVGAPLPTLEARLAACRRLVDGRHAACVALSMGGEGALLVSEAGAWRAVAPMITPVSTVGAGDSFMAGLVLALARGDGPADALAQGVAAGAAALLAPGTQLCRAADVQALAARVRVMSLPAGPAATATPPRPAAA